MSARPFQNCQRLKETPNKEGLFLLPTSRPLAKGDGVVQPWAGSWQVEQDTLEFAENRGSKNNCFPNSPARLSLAYLLVGDAGGALGGGLKVAIIHHSLSVKSTVFS